MDKSKDIEKMIKIQKTVDFNMIVAKAIFEFDHYIVNEDTIDYVLTKNGIFATNYQNKDDIIIKSFELKDLNQEIINYMTKIKEQYSKNILGIYICPDNGHFKFEVLENDICLDLIDKITNDYYFDVD